jgi:hypothetical protein
MDCFAEPVSGRASRDPLARNDGGLFLILLLHGPQDQTYDVQLHIVVRCFASPRND